jgi:hypothetical protein
MELLALVLFMTLLAVAAMTGLGADTRDGATHRLW